MVLRIGSRGSTLSRVQSQIVVWTLEKRGISCVQKHYVTSGDSFLAGPLGERGGQGFASKDSSDGAQFPHPGPLYL